MLRAWKAQLVDHYKPASVYRYMTMLTRALEWGWIAENPMHKLRKPSPGRMRIRFLTQDKRTRLLAACRASSNLVLYPLVVLAVAPGGAKMSSGSSAGRKSTLTKG